MTEHPSSGARLAATSPASPPPTIAKSALNDAFGIMRLHVGLTQVGLLDRFVIAQRFAGPFGRNVADRQHISVVGERQRFVGMLLDEKNGQPASSDRKSVV